MDHPGAAHSREPWKPQQLSDTCSFIFPTFLPHSGPGTLCFKPLGDTFSLYFCRQHLLSYLQAPKSLLAARVCKRRWPFSSWVRPWSLPRLCSWSAKYSACHAEQWNPELMFSRVDHWHPPTAITHGKSYLLLLSCSLRHNHSINNNKKMLWPLTHVLRFLDQEWPPAGLNFTVLPRNAQNRDVSPW